MSKITLDVDKNDVNTVLTILNNLKAGLIKNITVDNKRAPSAVSSKKIAKTAVLEDEFMPKPTSNSKYSTSAYKQRLAKTNK